MASKPETTFIASVHRHIPPEPLGPYHMKNSNDYNGGIADVWYSGSRADLWIEYKFLPRTPQRGIVWLCKPDVKAPDLTVLQQNWLRDRYGEGRNVGVIVGCPDGGVLMRSVEWECAFSAEEFRRLLMTRKDLAEWIIGETMR